MIKRFVILQDEALVMRELTKPRPSLQPAPQVMGVPIYSAPQMPATAADQGTPAYHSPSSGPGAAPPAPMPEPDEDEEVVDEDVPLASGPAGGQDGRRLADVAREAALAAERVAISDTLKQVHWNRRKAAQLLGVSYKTLLNKIKETGIERP